jgi:hypothetical protein
VNEIILRLIRPRLELLALLALSMSAGDRTRPGVPVHVSIFVASIPRVASIPLAGLMANLTTKKTMPDSLVVRYSLSAGLKASRLIFTLLK